MTLADALPDRPLTMTEIAALDDADGVDGAEPVAYDAGSGGVVCVAVAVEGNLLTLGWHPDRPEWEIIRRESRK